MSGRNHVLPDDVQVLAHAVLAHRLLPSTDAQLARRTPEDVVAEVLAEVPVPAPGHRLTATGSVPDAPPLIGEGA